MNPWFPVIVSLIRSNHDINFILSSVKAFTLFYYITNYTIKRDYNQYQRIIAIAIVKKIFEDQNKPGSKPLFYMPTLDKFLLKVFNKLLQNREFSGTLVMRFLLDLLDYYIPNALG